MYPMLSASPGKRFRPIAVIVDELASFDLDNLEGVLEKGRKFGLVAFAGIQNVAQLRKKYGADGATTLMACFRTKVVFNPGDAETAKRMAEELGRQTVERREVSYSNSAGRSSTSQCWRQEERWPFHRIVSSNCLTFRRISSSVETTQLQKSLFPG